MTYTLHHGDCLDVLRELPANSVDTVITDPPYPGLAGGVTYETGKVAPVTHATTTVGTPWGSELAALTEAKRVARYGAIVFCSWHSIGQMRDLLGGEAVGLVSWYQRNAQNSFRNRPHYQCEYAWLIEYAPGLNWRAIKTFYDIPRLQAGCMATERVLMEGSGRAAHPTQKPVRLMAALMEATPPGATVLDPFMGSGTTGVACAQTGRNFIGIEIDPDYFAIAQKRIENAAAQLHLPLWAQDA